MLKVVEEKTVPPVKLIIENSSGKSSFMRREGFWYWQGRDSLWYSTSLHEGIALQELLELFRRYDEEEDS